jgi:molybdopterin guanine dinucleotide-containing S/N-oxide reductase-like protein
MLLQPGEAFDYDGQLLTYPDVKLVYWAGGNPFHHHQDLGRLRRSFARPDTVIVHESAWTATARHADIVLPATITLEREDIGATAGDPLMIAMHRAVAPYREARDDYDIFTGLAERLGIGEAFTEGRTARQWLEHIYEPTCRALAERGINTPDFAQFWDDGELALPAEAWDGGIVRAFRRDPAGSPLPTPSGKIEIASAAIAAFGYADCPGHPVWLPFVEGAGSAAASRFPLHLIANQPATRLHSQLDFGATSLASKIAGREPVRIHPQDAAARGIRDGDIVRLYNERGACLAGAVLSDALRPGGCAAVDRRLVRPRRSRRRDAVLRARQPERLDPRRRHLAPGAGLHRPAHPRRDRAVRRPLAPDQGLRPATRRLTLRLERRLLGRRGVEAARRLRQAVMLAQRRPLIGGAEQPAALQQRHHLGGEHLELQRQ